MRAQGNNAFGSADRWIALPAPHIQSDKEWYNRIRKRGMYFFPERNFSQGKRSSLQANLRPGNRLGAFAGRGSSPRPPARKSGKGERLDLDRETRREPSAENRERLPFVRRPRPRRRSGLPIPGKGSQRSGGTIGGGGSSGSPLLSGPGTCSRTERGTYRRRPPVPGRSALSRRRCASRPTPLFHR